MSTMTKPVSTICDLTFTKMEFLNIHMNKVHKETLDTRISRLAKAAEAELEPSLSKKVTFFTQPSKLLDCSECGNIFNYKSEIDKHIETEHNKETKGDTEVLYKCRECSFRGNSEEQLKEHKREEKLKAKSKYSPPGSLIMCLECDKKFTDIGFLDLTNFQTRIQRFYWERFIQCRYAYERFLWDIRVKIR